MRIAMLSWESLHSFAVGGVAAHVSELAEALAGKGHDVHIFTRIDREQSPYELIGSVHYHRCAYDACDDFIDDVNSMCGELTQAVIETEDYIGPFDVVHAHDWLAANAMIWIKQARGRRSVLTIHSTEYARCGNCFPDGRPARVREQERAGTYWADRVIAVSGVTGDEVRWMYNVPNWKSAVIHNGVQPDRFDLNLDPGAIKQSYGIAPLDPTILFCGRLAHQKGPDLLLEAAPSILTHYPNAKFVFVGDGEMRPHLAARASQLGLDGAVRLLGYRNGEELPRIYRMADLVCVPSRNEPFGIVVLEAWSAGKPVVVTQVGGPSEYVDHNVTGLKVFPSTDSIAWGLSTALMDVEGSRVMGRRGRSCARTRFAWDSIAEEVLGVYNPDYTPAVPEPNADELSAERDTLRDGAAAGLRRDRAAGTPGPARSNGEGYGMGDAAHSWMSSTPGTGRRRLVAMDAHKISTSMRRRDDSKSDDGLRSIAEDSNADGMDARGNGHNEPHRQRNGTKPRR